MSLVGPRAELPEFVHLFQWEYEEILRIRPGITDLASLKYCDEAQVLGKAENAEEEYIQHVLPDKIRLAKDYLRRSSFLFDLSLILKTLGRLFAYRSELKQSRGIEFFEDSTSLSDTTSVQSTMPNPVSSPRDRLNT